MKYLHIGLVVALIINLLPLFEEENASVLGSYNGGDAHQFRVEKEGKEIEGAEVWISHRIGSERRANDRTVAWIIVFYAFYGTCTSSIKSERTRRSRKKMKRMLSHG